ncbi:MAG: ferritin [Bacilli bacterium]
MKKELADLVNKQINFEIYSAHIYLNMACYLSSQGLNGFRNWFDVQYQEELAHSKKLIDFLLQRGYTPTITNWDENPATEYNSVLEVAEIALIHEKEVTARFSYLIKKADELSDYASANFLNWFVYEQVEEEANFIEMIQKIKLFKNAGLYLLDQEYANRVFVDINAQP